MLVFAAWRRFERFKAQQAASCKGDTDWAARESRSRAQVLFTDCASWQFYGLQLALACVQDAVTQWRCRFALFRHHSMLHGLQAPCC